MDIEAVTPIQEFIAKGGWLPILVFMLASIYGLFNQRAKPGPRKFGKLNQWILDHPWKTVFFVFIFPVLVFIFVRLIIFLSET